MNPSDVIVLCAMELPIEQQIDLVKWYALSHHEEIEHPSLIWWIKKNADEICARAAKEYWRTH